MMELDVVCAQMELSDLGNAKRFLARFGNRLLYSEAEKSWYVWTGKKWEKQAGDRAAMSFARQTVEAMWNEVNACRDTEGLRDRHDALAKHYAFSQGARDIGNMVRLAATWPDISIDPAKLDANHMLLGVANGTIDLHTGTIHPHRPADRITKLLEVEYDPDAQCPTWKSFLERVQPDAEIRQYLQKFAGYCLTGYTREQIFIFAFGVGANGKSTFINALAEIMAPLHQRLTSDTLMAKISDSETSCQIAELRGKRLGTLSEVEETAKINEALLKDLTGGETITARRKYEHPVTFMPTTKLIMAGNHKPLIRGTDRGIWRRMRLIPFSIVIPDWQLDKTLGQRLRDEYAGILNWMLDGLRLYLAEGLVTPEAVDAATAQYKEESDTLGLFLQDKCYLASAVTAVYPQINPKFDCLAADMYTAYREWCAENGAFVLPSNVLSRRLADRGIVSRRSSRGAVYSGIELKRFRPDVTVAVERTEAVAEGRIKRETEPCFRQTGIEEVDELGFQ